MPTEINAERARDLAKLVRSVRSPGTTNEEVAAALEQLAGLLEEIGVYRQRDIETTDALVEQDHQLAAERERISSLEGQLADARALRSGIQFRESALVDRYEERGARIATLERKLAEAREDAERYRALRAILQGEVLVPGILAGSRERWALSTLEHELTDLTTEEIDAAVDATRAAQGEEQ